MSEQIFVYRDEVLDESVKKIVQCGRDRLCAKPHVVDAVKEIYSMYPCDGCSEIGIRLTDFWDDATHKLLNEPYNEDRLNHAYVLIDNIKKGIRE